MSKRIRPIKELVLNIRGRDWSFWLLNDSTFNKHHNDDGGNRPGVTMPADFQVHFRRSDWTVKDIRHELGHVFFAMYDNHSTDLTADQVEEQMCSIIGDYYADIGYFADRIIEKWQS